MIYEKGCSAFAVEPLHSGGSPGVTIRFRFSGPIPVNIEDCWIKNNEKKERLLQFARPPTNTFSALLFAGGARRCITISVVAAAATLAHGLDPLGVQIGDVPTLFSESHPAFKTGG